MSNKMSSDMRKLALGFQWFIYNFETMGPEDSLYSISMCPASNMSPNTIFQSKSAKSSLHLRDQIMSKRCKMCRLEYHWGFRPGLTQTGLCSDRRRLEAGNVGFMKKMGRRGVVEGS